MAQNPFSGTGSKTTCLIRCGTFAFCNSSLRRPVSSSCQPVEACLESSAAQKRILANPPHTSYRSLWEGPQSVQNNVKQPLGSLKESALKLPRLFFLTRFIHMNFPKLFSRYGFGISTEDKSQENVHQYVFCKERSYTLTRQSCYGIQGTQGAKVLHNLSVTGSSHGRIVFAWRVGASGEVEYHHGPWLYGSLCWSLWSQQALSLRWRATCSCTANMGCALAKPVIPIFLIFNP